MIVSRLSRTTSRWTIFAQVLCKIYISNVSVCIIYWGVFEWELFNKKPAATMNRALAYSLHMQNHSRLCWCRLTLWHQQTEFYSSINMEVTFKKFFFIFYLCAFPGTCPLYLRDVHSTDLKLSFLLPCHYSHRGARVVFFFSRHKHVTAFMLYFISGLYSMFSRLRHTAACRPWWIKKHLGRSEEGSWIHLWAPRTSRY